MTKHAYCPECMKEVEYEIIEQKIDSFKGVNVNVIEKIGVCVECHNEIFVEELETENLNNLYSKYREVAGIVSPSEIASFLGKYGISQRELVAILGWGKMTINRYIRGSLPTKSHSDMLKLIISDDAIFMAKVEDAYQSEKINEKTYKNILDQVSDSKNNILKKLIADSLTHKESIYNGFREFNLDRLINLISYLADNVELYKTSLNKYLWFIDFESFRRHTRSICGIRYVRYTYGPIIEDHKYNDIINSLDDKFYKEEYENDCNVATIIKSKKNYDMSIFKDEEMEVINEVINKLKNKTCTSISNLSHLEDAWKQNKNNDLITYEYAKSLKMQFN